MRKALTRRGGVRPGGRAAGDRPRPAVRRSRGGAGRDRAPRPHDDIDISYGALRTYVAEHALAVAGPVRENHLVGPRDTGDATAWRTEIGWPVFRTSAG